MPTYKESYIDVKGSDNNLYLVEMERIDRNTTEFSLLMGRTRVDKDYLNSTNNDISTKLVEDFIKRCKDRFGVPKKELYDILNILTSSTVDNHFAYLRLLRELTPKFEKLLQ